MNVAQRGIFAARDGPHPCRPHSPHLCPPRRIGGWSADRLPARGNDPELGSGTWPDPAHRLSVHMVLRAPGIGVKQCGGNPTGLDDLYPPVLFASNAFVPTSTMSAWLGAFAEHQPLSVFITAVRGLVLNQPDATAIWQAIAWCVGLLVVFILVAVWAYGRRNERSE
jgi:hypothetical protein